MNRTGETRPVLFCVPSARIGRGVTSVPESDPAVWKPTPEGAGPLVESIVLLSIWSGPQTEPVHGAERTRDTNIWLYPLTGCPAGSAAAWRFWEPAADGPRPRHRRSRT